MADRDIDILVSGGGIAGLIAAAAFGAGGYRVLCVDPAPPVTDEGAAGADLRTTAFLQPSADLLARIGLWDRLAPFATPLQVMKIVDAGGAELTPRLTRAFDAADISDRPFGWNLPNWLLRREIAARLAELPGVEFRPGTATVGLTVREDAALVRLASGTGNGTGNGGAQTVAARLVVAADGRNSPVRAMLGIGALLDRRPALLSGGERARVAIGRALLSRPRLLILDEPLAALDAARRAEILPYLENLRDRTEVPILYISHAIAEVARLATTLVLVDAGRVTRAGGLEQMLADPATAALLDRDEVGAVLLGRVAGIEPDRLARIATVAGDLLVPGLAAEPGTAVRLRIRAAEVILSLTPPRDSSALNVLPATVAAIVPEGPTALVQLRLPGGAALLARITARSVEALRLEPGTPCHATVKSAGLVQGGG